MAEDAARRPSSVLPVICATRPRLRMNSYGGASKGSSINAPRAKRCSTVKEMGTLLTKKCLMGAKIATKNPFDARKANVPEGATEAPARWATRKQIRDAWRDAACAPARLSTLMLGRPDGTHHAAPGRAGAGGRAARARDDIHVSGARRRLTACSGIGYTAESRNVVFFHIHAAHDYTPNLGGPS